MGEKIKTQGEKMSYIFPQLDFCALFSVTIKIISVADPGCLSRIPDPDFYPSRIPDLGSLIQKQQQKTGVKKKFLSNHIF
jgi:hypothetical protein